MKRIGIVVLALISGASAIFSQSKERVFPLLPEDTVEERNCGLKLNRLFSLLQFSDREALILVVSHLGSDERAELGHRRLWNIKTLFNWDNLKYKRQRDSVLVAEGERNQHKEPGNDKGHLDFYVGGELKLRIVFEKNVDIHLGDCAPDPGEKPCDTSYEKMFYPCRKS